MPRQLRVEYPGALNHFRNWVGRREDIFLGGVNRQDWLKPLAEARQKTG